MKKVVFATTLVLSLLFTETNAEETRTYNQPPVINGEFTVEQEDQKAFANLSKDTDAIIIENDFLGLKKFANETFNSKKVEERYKQGLEKLREDKSTQNVVP